MKLLVVLFTVMLSNVVFSQEKMSASQAYDKAESACYFYNTACALGVEIASNAGKASSNLNDQVDSVLKKCVEDIDTDLRKISCLHGALFYISKLNGKEALRKRGFKTIPFIVYTSGHALGVTISMLRYLADKNTFLYESERECEIYSFDSDVLKRCHQGIAAFKSVL